MIELLTGAPGVGKTTFAVAKRLLVEADREVDVPDAIGTGSTRVKRRIVCAGFRGLLLEHEQLPHRLTGNGAPAHAVAFWNQTLPEPQNVEAIYKEFLAANKKLEYLEDEPLFQRLPTDPPLSKVQKGGTLQRLPQPDLELHADGTVHDAPELVTVPCLVQNWWLWCRPGDLIVVDEVQFLAPRGALGRKAPFWIQLLEIHRHYGVDFLLITQHPQLIDPVIRNLVGLHRHVRSFLGTSLCTVFSWDHASNPERFSMANKAWFRRRAKYYKLFHSTAAVIKPPATGRLLPAIALGMLLLAPFLWFNFKSRLDRHGAPGEASASTSSSGRGGQAAAVAAAASASASSPADVASFRVGGCWTVGTICKCILSDGRPYVPPSAQLCEVSSAGFDGLVKWRPREAPLDGGKGYGAAAGGQPGQVGQRAQAGPTPS